MKSIPAEVRIRLRIAWYSLRLIARRLDWTAFMGAWPAAALIVVAILVGQPLGFILAEAFVVLLVIFFYLARLPTVIGLAARHRIDALQLRAFGYEGLDHEAPRGRMISYYQALLEPAGQASGAEFQLTRFGSSVFPSICCPFEATTQTDELFSAYSGFVSAGEFVTHADARQAFEAVLDPADRRSQHVTFSHDRELGRNYVLTNFHAGPEPRLTIGVAEYGQIMRSCDASLLEFSCFSHFARKDAEWLSDKALMRLLPWRARAHGLKVHHRWGFQGGDRRPREARDLFVDIGSRAAGLGVAIVTQIGNDAAGERVLLARRTHNVGTYPNFWHVVPSGMCNTEGTEPSTEGDPPPATYLRTQMLAELYEEIFDDKALKDLNKGDWIDAVQKHIAEVHGSADGKASVSIDATGLAFDLLTLRPEVCGTAHVWGPGVETALNDEYHRSSAIRFQLSESALESRISPGSTVASGAAALRLALDWERNL